MNVTILTGTDNESVKHSWFEGMDGRGYQIKFVAPGDFLSCASSQDPRSNFLIDSFNCVEMPQAARILVVLHRIVWAIYWRPRIVLLANDLDFLGFARFESMGGVLVHGANEPMEPIFDYLTNRRETVSHHSLYAALSSTAKKAQGALAL